MQWQDSLSALYGEGWGRFLNSSVPIGRMLVHVPPTPAPTIMPVAGDKEHTSSPVAVNGQKETLVSAHEHNPSL